MFLKGGDTMGMIAALIFGGVFGFLICKLITSEDPVGTLQIETSDPDGPYLFLELSTDPRVIAKRKNVLLKVDMKSYISQQ